MKLAISTRRGGTSKTVTSADTAAGRAANEHVAGPDSAALAQAAAAYDIIIVGTPSSLEDVYQVSAEASGRD